MIELIVFDNFITDYNFLVNFVQYYIKDKKQLLIFSEALIITFHAVSKNKNTLLKKKVHFKNVIQWDSDKQNHLKNICISLKYITAEK